VDRAGADYDEETVVGVGVLDDGDGLVAAGEDGGARAGRLEMSDQLGRRKKDGVEATDLGYFMLEEVGRCERIVASDYGRSQRVSMESTSKGDGTPPIFSILLVADIFVFYVELRNESEFVRNAFKNRSRGRPS
jgi:hypothetical protein